MVFDPMMQPCLITKDDAADMMKWLRDEFEIEVVQRTGNEKAVEIKGYLGNMFLFFNPSYRSSGTIQEYVEEKLATAMEEMGRRAETAARQRNVTLEVIEKMLEVLTGWEVSTGYRSAIARVGDGSCVVTVDVDVSDSRPRNGMFIVSGSFGAIKTRRTDHAKSLSSLIQKVALDEMTAAGDCAKSARVRREGQEKAKAAEKTLAILNGPVEKGVKVLQGSYRPWMVNIEFDLTEMDPQVMALVAGILARKA